MKHRSAVLTALLLFTALLRAQSYCSPTFVNGCFSWNISAVTAGTINWSPGVDGCTVGDYTNLGTTVNAGESLGLSVTDGSWCGCAVWVDFDNSSSFEDGENLYYYYANIAATHTYDFSIDIPASVPTGAYRMRIVGPWGSDGFTPGNQNGFGPCGAYEYGNFKDFTLNVVGTTGIGDAMFNTGLVIAQDPTGGAITISFPSTIGQVVVLDAHGRMVEQRQVQGDRISLHGRAWAKGAYVVRLSNAQGVHSQRFVVD